MYSHAVKFAMTSRMGCALAVLYPPAPTVARFTLLFFLLVSVTSTCGGAVICYPPDNTSAISQCSVLYNDTLVLNGSRSRIGQWIKPATGNYVCSSTVCILTDLSYNMGGIYHFVVDKVSFQVNVSIFSPPYFTQCLEPFIDNCGHVQKTCQQFAVMEHRRGSLYKPRINLTVEGYDTAGFTVQWYHNCSRVCLNSTDPRKCGKMTNSFHQTVFYLEFPYLLEYWMVGDYMAVVSNTFGTNISHTNFNITDCYPSTQATFVVKPPGRSLNQPACKNKSLEIVFEVIVNYYANLYICFRKPYEPNKNWSSSCSQCPYGWNSECSKLLDRENWRISAQVGKCGQNRTINIHIPFVNDKDNGTIFLSYEINLGDRDGLAHVNVLVDVCRANSFILILEILVPLAVVILMIVIIIIIILRCGAVRKGGRGRYLNDVLQEERVVVPVMCGPDFNPDQPQLQDCLPQPDMAPLLRPRQRSPSTGYGSMMDRADVDTIHPTSMFPDLSPNLDSEKHNV